LSKKQFIRQSVIHNSPGNPGELKRVVEQAENRWALLTHLGYGDAKPSTPRETRNYYDELSQHQKTWFDKFWIAFNHKHGLQRACLAWSKLGEPAEAEYQKIVKAAAAENAKPRGKDEVRCMAERWINEHRFDDQTVVKKPEISNKKLELSNLINELKQLQQFQKATPSEAYAQRIAELEIIIDEKRCQ